MFAVMGIFEETFRSITLLLIVPFIGFAACILYLYFGIRCPSCKNPVAYLTYMNRGGYFHLSKNIRFCPFCGIEMDSDIDQTLIKQ
jgi:hypothetical protein